MLLFVLLTNLIFSTITLSADTKNNNLYMEDKRYVYVPNNIRDSFIDIVGKLSDHESMHDLIFQTDDNIFVANHDEIVETLPYIIDTFRALFRSPNIEDQQAIELLIDFNKAVENGEALLDIELLVGYNKVVENSEALLDIEETRTRGCKKKMLLVCEMHRS